MARRKINSRRPYVAPQKKAVGDSLASFTQSMSHQVMAGGFGGGYRDGPFSGYAKDATGVAASYYSTSWIARQAVEAIPEDCFKKGYQWVATPEQVTKLETTEKRHKIQQKKRQALSWSRLDGEAFIYFDIGDDPTKELSVDRVGADALRFVNVLRKRNVNKGQLISDPLSEFYGKPEYYEVTGQSGSVRIHPSRIVHFIASQNPETGEGQSVLNYLLPPIIAAETARDNVVALVTEALINAIGVEGLMDNVGDPETESLIVQRYNLMSNLKATNKTLIYDKDKEQFDRKPASFATLPDVIEAMRREASAAIGRPYSLMFGRASGLGTNGDSEVREYYDTISTMQRNEIQPECEMLDEVVIRSSLGSRPPEIYIEWSSLWETSDQEKANISKTYAEAAKTAVDAGIMVPNMLTTSLMNAWVEIGAFPGIEQDVEEHIAEMEEQDADEVDVLRPEENDDTVSA